MELISLEIEEIFLNMMRRLDRFGIVKGLDAHEICKVDRQIRTNSIRRHIFWLKSW